MLTGPLNVKQRATSGAPIGRLTKNLKGHASSTNSHRPLSDKLGQRRINRSTKRLPVHSPVSRRILDDERVPIAVALGELDSLLPGKNITIYQAGFDQYKILDIQTAQGLHRDFLEQKIGLPGDVVAAFSAHIDKMVQRARRGGRDF